MAAADPPSPVWTALRAFTSQQARIAVAAGGDLDQLVAAVREHSGHWQNPQDVPMEEHARWFQEEGLALLDRGYALQTRLWGQTQLVLSAAGNVSKALWPSQKRHRDLKAAFPDRGEKLRAYFGVQEDSPLADLSLRNVFEHFDEKIERAALDGQDIGVWFDGMVGDLHNITPEATRRSCGRSRRTRWAWRTSARSTRCANCSRRCARSLPAGPAEAVTALSLGQFGSHTRHRPFPGRGEARSDSR